MTEIVQQRHDCGYKSYVAGYVWVSKHKRERYIKG